MMHVLHHINQDLVRDTTLTVALDAHLDVICIIMHDFGTWPSLLPCSEILDRQTNGFQ